MRCPASNDTVTVEHPHVLAFALALELAFFSSAASAQNTPAVPAESPARGAVDVRQFTDNEPAAAAKSGKTLHALRVSGNAPKIDGTLDDDVWTHAEMAGDFVQWDPNNGEPAS